MLLNERKDRDDDLQKRVVIKAGDSDIFDLWPEKKKIPYEIHTSIGTGKMHPNSSLINQ